MRKGFLYIILFLAAPYAAISQTYDIGVFAGLSYYQGDIAPDIILGQSHPAFGVSFKRNMNDGYFCLSANLNYGEISGADSISKANRLRNLSFRSPIVELSGQLEFNFYQFYATGVIEPHSWTPYVYTGLSGFYFNPQAYYKGSWVDLQPLGTEGQGALPGAPKPYSRVSAAIPIGGGIKWHISQYLNINLHCSFQTTFTDYLDDVSSVYPDLDALTQKGRLLSAALADRSGEINGGANLGTPGLQRGNPDNKDWYIFSGFTFSYIIPNPVCYFHF